MKDWLIEEIESLLKDPRMDADDANRIKDAIRRLKVKSASISFDTDMHMDLESELSWLASKYDFLQRESKRKLEKYAAVLTLDARKIMPHWATMAFVSNDDEYDKMLSDFNFQFRLFNYLDKLQSSMWRRASILKLINGGNFSGV